MSDDVIQNKNKNISLVLHKKQDMRVSECLRPPPSEFEAEVEVKATGLCGSDLHYYHEGRNGPFELKQPMILGHESSGVITMIGSGVSTKLPNLKVGTRVAIEAGKRCGACDRCRDGRYNLCPNMKFAASAKLVPHESGWLKRYIVHPAELLHPLPPEVSFTEGAIVEPLAVTLHAATRLSLSPGQSVLVVGAGAVGLLACAVAKGIGCSNVCVTDVVQHRLDFALENGWADKSFVTPPLTEKLKEAIKGEESGDGKAGAAKRREEEQLKWTQEVGEMMKDVFGEPNGFDAVLECTGNCIALQSAIFTCRSGAKVGIIGIGAKVFPIPASAPMREVDIIGVFRYANIYPRAIGMIASGSLPNLERLVTQRYPLLESTRAFEAMVKGTDEQGKGVVKVIVEH